MGSRKLSFFIITVFLTALVRIGFAQTWTNKILASEGFYVASSAAVVKPDQNTIVAVCERAQIIDANTTEYARYSVREIDPYGIEISRQFFPIEQLSRSQVLSIAHRDGFTYISWDYADGIGRIDKLNSSLELLWEKSYNRAFNEIKFTRDGKLMATGSGTWNFNQTQVDIFCALLDTSGYLIWRIHYPVPHFEWGYDIEEDWDGNFMVLSPFQVGNGGKWITTVRKVDKDFGTEIWRREYGENFTVGTDLAVHENGYVVCGYASDDWGDTSKAFVFSIDQEGWYNWIKVISDTIDFTFSHIEPISTGGFLVLGTKEYLDDDHFYDSTTTWAVRLDDYGKTKWEKEYMTESRSSGVKFFKNKSGGYTFFGKYRDNGVSSNYLLTTNYFGGITEGNEQQDSASVRVFPNPVAERGHVLISNYDPSKQYHLHIYDDIGQLVDVYENAGGLIEMKASDHSNGLYLYQVLEDQSVIGKGNWLILRK